MSSADSAGITRSWGRTGLNRPRSTVKLTGTLSPGKDSDLDIQSVTLHRGQLAIGREADNGLVIPDTSVSRYHARIRRVGNNFIIDDLESRNGTYVDGIPVIHCVLRSGDEIQIGRYLLFFEQLVDAVPLDEPSK